jgi:hypothetical protein
VEVQPMMRAQQLIRLPNRTMADPSATPLSNADFRKLLATPRVDRSGATPAGGIGGATPRGGGGGGGAKGGDGKAKKPYRPKPKPKEDKEEDDDEPKYR